ncbi:MAG: zf-HC2 domain-containing protein [Nitriliruptorales bacterium]
MSCDCPDAVQRLGEFLDGELDDEAIHEISGHLSECYPCGSRADFERHLREVVRIHVRTTAPAGLVEKVRARCRQEAQRSAAEGIDPRPEGGLLGG